MKNMWTAEPSMVWKDGLHALNVQNWLVQFLQEE